MHPLDYGNAVDFDSSFAYLDDHSLEEVVRRISGLVEPFVVSHGRVVAKTGETIYGEFITLPRTAEQFVEMRKEDAADYVRAALHLARDRGAEMVGLGAFTSIVTLGGRAVRDEGVPVTTGNSYAAVASAEAARMAVALSENRDDGPLNTAILGATGAIGRAMALMLAEDVGRLTLVGNPNSSRSHVRERLLARAADLVDFIAARHAEGMSFKPHTLAARLLTCLPCPREKAIAQLERTGWLVLTQETKSAVRGARLVITATSDAGTLIGPEDLQQHAVVCDVSRPANVSRQVTVARPDVLVIDGGIIAVPDEFSPESVWAWPRLGLRLHGGNDDAHSGRTPAQYQHRNGLVARNPAPAAIARGPVWLRSRSAAQLWAAGGAIRRPGGYPASLNLNR